MAHIVEIRGGVVIANDQPADMNLPVGTHVQRPDGHYLAFGMDLEGPYARDQAAERLAHLKRATRKELDAEDQRKQQP